MPYKDPRKAKYKTQVKNLRNSGSKAKMLFTFEEWVQWWEENLGPDWMNLRGPRKNQYVMARIKDQGDYHRDNVYCATASQNMIDSNYLKPRGGGPFFNGRRHKPETIEKMSRVKKGSNNPYHGRRHGPEARDKMRTSWVNSREDRCKALREGWAKKHGGKG